MRARHRRHRRHGRHGRGRRGPAVKDVPAIVAIAAGCALVGPALAVLALRLLRASSIRVWGAVIVVSAVVAMGAGVAGAAKEMFISPHDLRVVLLVLAVCTVVATVTALALGRPLTSASAALTEQAAMVGDDDYLPLYGASLALPSGPRTAPPTAEFAALARALRRSHRRLLAAREREQALEASRRELVAWISHDLRTPIAGIRATAEALRDGVVADPATVARYHQVMVESSERLTTMVDDLFELSRVHAGRIAVSAAQVPLADIVSDALSTADPLARAKGVYLRADAAVTAADRVTADVGELSRALANLLVNAIRHTPSDGTVALTARRRDARVEVAVADCCGGIPEADLGRVFEAGFRGEPARTAAGSGMGLAIVRGIAEAHGGAVSVSNTAAGCRFVLALPAA